jgi:hypothetical protein
MRVSSILVDAGVGKVREEDEFEKFVMSCSSMVSA